MSIRKGTYRESWKGIMAERIKLTKNYFLIVANAGYRFLGIDIHVGTHKNITDEEFKQLTAQILEDQEKLEEIKELHSNQKEENICEYNGGVKFFNDVKKILNEK